MHKPYPISHQKIIKLKSHTLWRSTYLYSLYKGVTPRSDICPHLEFYPKGFFFLYITNKQMKITNFSSKKAYPTLFSSFLRCQFHFLYFIFLRESKNGFVIFDHIWILHYRKNGRSEKGSLTTTTACPRDLKNSSKKKQQTDPHGEDKREKQQKLLMNISSKRGHLGLDQSESRI